PGVTRTEPIPGPRGLERLADRPEPDEAVAEVGRVEERRAPGLRGGVLAGGLLRFGLRRAPVVRGALDREAEEMVDRGERRLEAEDQHRRGAVSGARGLGL